MVRKAQRDINRQGGKKMKLIVVSQQVASEPENRGSRSEQAALQSKKVRLTF